MIRFSSPFVLLWDCNVFLSNSWILVLFPESFLFRQEYFSISSCGLTALVLCSTFIVFSVSSDHSIMFYSKMRSFCFFYFGYISFFCFSVPSILSCFLFLYTVVFLTDVTFLCCTICHLHICKLASPWLTLSWKHFSFVTSTFLLTWDCLSPLQALVWGTFYSVCAVWVHGSGSVWYSGLSSKILANVPGQDLWYQLFLKEE